MVSAPRQHPEGAATPSTALKWSSDGELSPLDLQRLVDRLQRTDPVAQEQLHPSHFSALSSAPAEAGAALPAAGLRSRA